MKNIFSKLLIGGFVLLSLAACSDDEFDRMYADPSTTSTVGVPQMFTSVMYQGNTWMNPMYYRYYTQSTTSGTFSGVIGNSNERGRFRGAGEGYFNTRWKNFYNLLTQYRVLENTYETLSDSEKETNEIFVYLARTVMQSQLHEMLSLFGSVPYSGSGRLAYIGYVEAKTQDVYDKDEDIYKEILSDLKEVGDYFAAGNFSANGLSYLSSADFTTAKGSTSAWQKYVNSLRLRIALHLATNGNLVSEAKTAIGEILGNPTKYPLIDSNDENIGVTPSTNDDTFNFGKSLSQALRTGSYSNVSQAYIDALNVPSNGKPDANTDPRLVVLLDPNPDGEYISYDLTKTSTEISNISSDKSNEYIEKYGTAYGASNYYCVIDSLSVAGYQSYSGNNNIEGIWISAAEVSFSKAEAYLMGYGVSANATTAKTEFLKGMQQSTDYYWDNYENSTLAKPLGDGTYNDSYRGYRVVSKPSAAEQTAYFESAWKGTQECICTQLWLNFGFMNELEAWNVVRRTGFPKVTFATDTQTSGYGTPPYRLPYPSDELNYNATNCQAAISAYYKESTGYYTNLFWAKENYYTLIN